jgi:hypothetical protein
MLRRRKRSKPEAAPTPGEPIISPQRIAIDHIMAPLRTNMPNAGDFSFEAIKALENPVPMIVTNGGESLLELWLEPFGQDYWLLPGETVTVTSYGSWNDHPFETLHEANRLTVWATSWFATVCDGNGDEVPGGRNRPPEANA